MKDDKEHSTNKEVERSEAFQKRVETKAEVIKLSKELLESTTDEEFAKLGYEQVEGAAGFYGDGSSYGAGAEENKYNITIEGVTNASLTKKLTFGTKRAQSDINFELKDGVINVEYKTVEAGAFRGVVPDDDAKIPFTLSKTISVSIDNTSKLKSALKNLFKEAAKKEIGYLTSTKLGVEDKTTKSTASTVNENKMKNITIKSLFENDVDIVNESKKKSEENIEAVKSANTIPLKDLKPKIKGDKDQFMFLDTDSDKKAKTVEERDAELKEITTSGPVVGGAQAGAGGFLTPFAFKATPYAQGKKHKRPKIDNNYNVVPESKGNKDGFWQVVKIDPNTHPLGMPGVKPNSKEEFDKTTKGDFDKMKRMGLSEEAKPDLTIKKMFSESENKAKGVNKRYLITETTTEEYLKARWNKMSNFKLNETIEQNIEKLEEEDYDTTTPIKSADISSIEKERFAKDKQELNDLVKLDPSQINEETIDVTKPNSLFNIEYKFYKKDFLNENKKYILDLNSRVFVPNPNVSK